MSILSFINKWLTGAKLIGALLALEVVLFAVIGIIIGLVILVGLLPKWVLGVAFAVVLFIFGPWAIHVEYV